jgi:hypothetical protein
MTMMQTSCVSAVHGQVSYHDERHGLTEGAIVDVAGGRRW